MVQLIDRMLEVPEALAFRSLVRSVGVAPSARAVLASTIPEVATCFSVAMFGTTGVVFSMTCVSISTWAVEAYDSGFAA